jgi:hypothetical protein
MLEHLPDAADLWQAVCHVRKAWAAYRHAQGIPSPHATSLRILTPVEAAHVDALTAPRDERPEADRARAAINTYMATRGWVSHAGSAAESALIRAVVDEPEGEVRNWSLVVQALRCVLRGMRGEIGRAA